MEVCHLMEEKKHILTCIPARLATVVQHVFMAAIILVMDICFNKSEEDEGRGKGEVTQACKILDDLKCESPMARRFLDPLMEILRKHRIILLHQSPTLRASQLATEKKDATDFD